MAWRQRSVWRGLVAGLAGGFVASWTMNEFQKGWSAAADAIADGKPKKKPQDPAENTTAKTADAIVQRLLGRPLSREQKRKAGPIVHYAFGTMLGGLYGAASEVIPQIRIGNGVPYGTAVFVGVDEIALPALKLAKGPTEYPVSTHLYGLASHVVWSATTEGVRRLVRWAI
ncbi:MAG: DUF1440 domain-containing protein [Candidatus Acidiferrales bacterium]